MITENNFSKDWVYSICDLLKRGKNQADPELVEKVINALYLLESIKKVGLKFIFKGGTALLLLLNKIHRFSIVTGSITSANVKPKTREWKYSSASRVRLMVAACRKP